jgi:hypothetical protein
MNDEVAKPMNAMFGRVDIQHASPPE